MRKLLALLCLLIGQNSFAEYLAYDTSGRITTYRQDAPSYDGKQYVEFNGVWSNDYFQTKKIVNGQLVDNAEYGKKLVISGATTLTGNGIDTLVLTIKTMNRYDTEITDVNRSFDVSTTRGKLSGLSVLLNNGVGKFTFRGVDETIDCEITVTDPTGEFRSVTHTIQLTP